MLLQPEKSNFILALTKEVEAHEHRNHWTLIIKSEVNNNHKNKDGQLNTILSIWYFKRKIFSYRRLMKHKSRLFLHGGMKQWGVKYWETYSPVVN